jgi:hypothetical protein
MKITNERTESEVSEEPDRIPAASRADVVDLIMEFERRYQPRRWYQGFPFSFSIDLADLVRNEVTEPLRAALLCGYVKDLDKVARHLTGIEMRDDCGNDYSIRGDWGARVKVLALEARHRITNGGAPFPP